MTSATTCVAWLLLALAAAACSSSSNGAGADAASDHASSSSSSGSTDAGGDGGHVADAATDGKHDAVVHADAGDGGATKDAPSGHETGSGGDGSSDATTDVLLPNPDAHVSHADTGVDAGPPALRYVGRTLTDGTDPDGNGNCTAGAPCFEWSGTQVIARFSGATAYHLSMSDYGNYFDVYIDGMLQASPIIGSMGQTDYTVASGLSASATHEVSLYKRTEASSNGRTQILGYSFPGGGSLLPPAPAQTRRIEVIGDSITCGYGILGANGGCTPDPSNEDHDATYAAITARTLDADLYTIASSGRGVTVNIDGTTTDTLPNIYGLTLPYGGSGLWTSQWAFASWVPDVVVIDLGTNDFLESGSGDPGQPFVTAYLAFVRRIRANYPNAWIFCANGPLLSGDEYTTAQTDIQSVVTMIADAKVMYIAFPTQPQDSADQGCDGHPNRATDQSMATQLTAAIKTSLNW